MEVWPSRPAKLLTKMRSIANTKCELMFEQQARQALTVTESWLLADVHDAEITLPDTKSLRSGSPDHEKRSMCPHLLKRIYGSRMDYTYDDSQFRGLRANTK